MEKIKEDFLSFSTSHSLVSEEKLLVLFEKLSDCLENEWRFEASPRPVNAEGKSGGLLDFSSSNFEKIILVPDIHGRREFLLNLMNLKIKGFSFSVMEGLASKKLCLLCLGDGVHGEGRVRQRWLKAYDKWLEGNLVSPEMKEELIEDLGVMCQVALLKTSFPESFHFLKGNHENVLNIDGGGDFAFRKFVQEGEMVKDFLRSYYGDAVIHLIHLCERSFPVCAVFPHFGVSHSEVGNVYSRNEIINAFLNPDIISDFTWVGNDGVNSMTCSALHKELVSSEKENINPFWIAGHRPVKGDWKSRQNGTLFQIHNPEQMKVLLLDKNQERFEDSIFLDVENHEEFKVEDSVCDKS